MRISSLSLAIDRLQYTGSGAGPNPPAATAGAPVNREVIATATGYTASCTAPSDTAVNFAVNGVSQGAMTPGALNTFTFAWTTPTPGNYTITFVGNISGASTPLIVTIREANTWPETINTWGNSGYAHITAPVGITPPVSNSGNGIVYKYQPMYNSTTGAIYINKTLSPVASISQMGIDVWIGLLSGSNFNCIQFNFSNGGGYFNFVTEESTMGHNYAAVVERKVVNGITWKRIQVMPDETFGATISSSWFLYLTKDFTGTTSTTGATDAIISGVYVYHMQATGTIVLPMTPRDKLSQHIDPAATLALGTPPTGCTVQQRDYKHPYMNQPSDDGGGAYPGGSGQFKIVYPPSYNPALGNYKLITFLPALSDSTETGTGHPTAWAAASDAAANYASTYNAVVVVVYDKDGACWWGKFTNGTHNAFEFLTDVFMPFAIDTLGVSPARKDHILCGYSKSGQMSVSQMLLRPDIWGIVVCGDGAFLNVYPGNASNGGFDTAAQYNAYDAEHIYLANLTSINDRPRLVITFGSAWGPDYTDFTGKLDAASVVYTKYTSAWTYHGWGPTGINTGWTPVAVAAGMALQAAL